MTILIELYFELYLLYWKFHYIENFSSNHSVAFSLVTSLLTSLALNVNKSVSMTLSKTFLPYFRVLSKFSCFHQQFSLLGFCSTQSVMEPTLVAKRGERRRVFSKKPIQRDTASNFLGQTSCSGVTLAIKRRVSQKPSQNTLMSVALPKPRSSERTV